MGPDTGHVRQVHSDAAMGTSGCFTGVLRETAAGYFDEGYLVKDVPITFDLRENDRDRRGLPIPFVVYRDMTVFPTLQSIT
jgi:hypothetical protein